MTITLESSIIHILNTAEEYPILSNRPFPLDSEVKDYLTKTIEKTISSDDVKNCFFRSETNIWQQCKDVSWNLISVSQSIAKEMFIIMRRNKEIPVADLLFGIANVDSHRYFFMLKLDYRSAFTHFVKTIDSQISINIIQHHALFPAQAPKIVEGFLIDMDMPSVKVIERKYILEASNPVPTPLLGHRCRSSQEITGSPTPFSTSNHYLWIWLSASFSLSNPNIAA